MGESDPNDSDPLNQVFASFSRVTHAGYSRVRGLVDSLGENTLRPLMDTDIRTLSAHQDEAELTAKTGPQEGHRLVSWIYMVPGTSGESAQLDEGAPAHGKFSWLSGVLTYP